MGKLREPPPPLGRLLTVVPGAPPHFQPRPHDLTTIAQAVLADWEGPAHVEGGARMTVLHGMGGAGKSVLAAVFARLMETRRAFPGGVAWISYGEGTAIQDALWQAGRAFGGRRDQYSDADSAVKDLAGRLAPLRCLLVIDNAGGLEQVEPFAKALGVHGRLLIATRNVALATSLGANVVAIGELSAEAALVHLADWAGTTPDALPAEARDVARRCGGLPFATALCGAMAGEGTPWRDLLAKLDEADLAFLRTTFQDYPHPTMLQCLKASVDVLAPAERDRYAELRIFAVTQPVPEQAVVRLWTRGGMMSGPDARQLVVTLKLRALLRVEGAAEAQRIWLHDLQHDLLRALYPEETTLHAELVASYREACGGRWAKGPEDGYYFGYLIYHLLVSHQREEAVRLLTGSDDWFRYKRFHAEHQAGLRRDIERCLLSIPDAAETARLCAVRQLIRYTATSYCDDDLKTLAHLGRLSEAANQARLRDESQAVARGLLAIAEESMAASTRWDEVEGRIREVADPRQRAHLLSRLACAMVDEQRAGARSLAVEVLNPPRPEEGREHRRFCGRSSIPARLRPLSSGLTQRKMNANAPTFSACSVCMQVRQVRQGCWRRR